MNQKIIEQLENFINCKDLIGSAYSQGYKSGFFAWVETCFKLTLDVETGKYKILKSRP